ncbi:MAG: GNAT family N-acetyltransferase [bacterium]|nr:GNAT family N-acetyltransferase [bacterium]
MIREVNINDAKAIVKIYNHYIKSSIATFEEEVISEEEIKNRITKVSKDYPWIVYEENGIVSGYAYATRWKDRNAYRFTAEIAVYVENGNEGKGIGTELLKNLIELSNKKGLNKLMAGIAIPNEASIALHERFGFEKCAHFKQSGYKFGKWIDVGYWEKILV